MSDGGVKHDYHLTDPSPWPVVGALGAFLTAVGAVLWLNKGYAGFGVLAGIPWICGIGLALVAFTATGWWRDIVAESVREDAFSPVVKLGFRYGMVLLLLAEAMFFAVFFSAWLHFVLFPRGAHPPGADPFDLPLLAAMILLTSATTVTWAYRAIGLGDKRGTVAALALTIALGIAFVAVAAPGNAASGLAVLQVLAATLFLSVALIRALAGHFTPQRHFGFEAAAWYWHFAAAAWLVTYAALVMLGR
jgi:cytochrome c oxidase subunit 3